MSFSWFLCPIYYLYPLRYVSLFSFTRIMIILGYVCPPNVSLRFVLSARLPDSHSSSSFFFFFVRKGRVLGPGLSVSCFSLLPLDGVCALFSDTPFWPGLVSRCSSSRTKDHAIAESDRSDRNQYRNQSEIACCVIIREGNS